MAENDSGNPLGREARNQPRKLRIDHPPVGQKKITSKTKKRAEAQVITRRELDGRSSAGRLFNTICRDIEADLGGHEQLSAVELQLVEAFAGAAVRLNDLNARALIGQTPPLDLSEYSNAVSSLVRIAARLGTRRRARDVTVPSLSEYVQRMKREEQIEVEAEEDAAS